MGRIYAGVELGGTKCVVILARGPGDVLEREVVPTASPEETLGRIETILSGWEFAALGIGSFGPLDLDRARPATAASPAPPSRGGRARMSPDGWSAQPTCPPHSTPTSTAPRWPRCAGERGRGSTISLTSPSAQASESGWSSMASRRAASAIASSAISESLGFPATLGQARARFTATALKVSHPAPRSRRALA